MAEEAKNDPQDRKRSPSFPTLTLEEAIKKVGVLYDEDKGNSITAEVMAAHWKSKTTSSAFMQWVASLKRFGLLVDAGKRQSKVSPLAIDILLMADDDPRWGQRIKRAALFPAAHQELWMEYGLRGLPSDANLRHKLVTAKGYQPNSAMDLIVQYKKTLAFAKLEDGDKIGEESEVDSGEGPKKIVDDKPIGDVFEPFFGRLRQQPPSLATQKRQPMQGELKQDTFTLDEGQVVLQWPAQLGEDSFADLKDWIDLQLRKIKRSVNPNLKNDGPAKIDMDPI